VRDLTRGAGAEFVFECAGAAATLEQMVELASPGGRIGAVGIPSDDRLAFQHSPARRKGLDVLMIRRANLTLHRALARVVQERLPLGRLATHHWPLDQVDVAFRTAGRYEDGVVKAIVNP
jgi:L-iditol 2-dehydrogenase